MKFSLRFNNDRPVAEYIALAQAAEQAGFDQFWVSDDLFLRSAVVILAAVAQATERIEIGTCILNPYTLNPAQMAMEAATLDELSGGRFNLGLSSGSGDFLQWVGIEQNKPRTAVIETVEAFNKLLNGERAAIDGRFLNWTDEAYLRFEPRRRIPVYVGAMSPRMLHTIGEIADGGLPLLFPPEHYQNVAPHIAAGAQAAGRSMDDLDIAACIWCSVSDDRAAAEDVLREKVAYYGHAMSETILNQLGLTHADFIAIEQAVMVENDMAKAKALVTDDMLKIGVAGTSADLITRLEGLVAMGARHLSFGPPLGPDPLEALRVIGRDVLPHFRSIT
ncbi:MAG: 5,10-methylene tetrahydromethanopterin reductase [Anaerolineaceae bacterium]|nr:5,10-methylene tetrahydromethanopterin reductase [Anaerolineaceae bacterium]